MQLKKKTKHILIAIPLGLAVALIVVEVFSLVVFAILKKDFYYITDMKPIDYLSQTKYLTDIRLHPYLGHITLNESGNNYGFAFDHDYPYNAREDEFIVGVFGGSVAESYASYEQEHRLLAETLSSVPDLKDKKVRILSFASGGFKQPQQLLSLVLFLSKGQLFDTVINIDGFNEVALSPLNYEINVDIFMPSVQHTMPLYRLDNPDASIARKLLKARSYKDKIVELSCKADRSPFASAFVLLKAYVRYLEGKYAEEINNIDRMAMEDQSGSIMHIDKVSPEYKEDNLYERISMMWYESSLLMHEMLSNRGTPYFHIVQPNQYFKTSREFSNKEKEIAFSKRSPYAKGVMEGYPKILARARLLEEKGVRVFNATELFDSVEDIVYSDNCCHYNEVGSRLFASYIAEKVSSSQDGLAPVPQTR